MTEPKTPAKAAKLPAQFTPRFWEGMDGRVGVAKEIRRRYETLRADTGASRSAQRDLLCQRAVFLAMILETQEVEAVESGKFDSGSYTQTVNALSGLLSKLGLDRAAVKATNLQDYLAERGK